MRKTLRDSLLFLRKEDRLFIEDGSVSALVATHLMDDADGNPVSLGLLNAEQ